MKKILSFVLVTTLATVGLAGLSLPNAAYGTENDSKAMEKAILVVKSVVKIPESYTDFDYNYKDASDRSAGSAGWNFSWSDNDDGKGHISAFVDNNGSLLSYDKYIYDEQQGLGKLTYDEGKITANDFLKKANSSYGKDMKITGNPVSNTGDSYNYNFALYKNDISVDFVRANLRVNKYKNEVVSYSFTGSNTKGDYPDKSNIISKEAAENSFISNGGITLKYFSDFDYKTKKLTIFPAYYVPSMNKSVDAKTGEIINSKVIDNNYAKEQATMDAGGSDRSANLTPGELEAIGKVNNLMTKEQAQAKASTYLKSLNYAFNPNSVSLFQNYIEKDKFNWEFSFDNGYVNLDAETGELIRLSLYDEPSGKDSAVTTITKDQAKIDGEKFAKSVVQGDKWNQVKESIIENKISYGSGSEPETYDFMYTRQANGIPFNSNAIRVSVNRYTGKVTGYSCTWYDNVTFPSIEKAIISEKAFDIVNSVGNFQLMYLNSNEGTRLGYKLTENVMFYIDALTGKKIRSDGKVYSEIAVPEYSDLAGHWVAPTVNTLKENGYYLTGNEFKPNNKITQESFLRYLYSPNQSGYDTEEFYAMMKRNGIIKEGENTPQKELQRQEASKFTVRYLGLDKAASLTNIYKNMYNDKVDSQYIGYAALANALKIISGDKNGNFSGTKSLTNAEAAIVIYRTLEVKF